MIFADIFLGLLLGIIIDQQVILRAINDEDITATDICPYPKVQEENGTKWTDEELGRMVIQAESLCVKKYSDHHCPSRIIKAGENRYKIACIRRK